jgi:hypothetical protein
MGGKSSAPPPPDYTPVAQADASLAASNTANAQQQFQLGQQQLQWGRDQFNTVWPYAQQYMQQQTATSQQENANAQNMQDFYNSTYKPIESQFAQTAQNYNSPARADQNAASAQADVSNSFTANRNAATSSLESYGIDPSQTRFGALDLGSRISEAAASAAAGTQSRLNTEATGLALQGEAINIGRGYPGSVAQAYSTATGAGASGIGTANSAINTGANAQGSPLGYFGGGNQSSGLAGQNIGNYGNALSMGYQNQLSSANFNRQNAQNQSQGIGSLLGGALGFGMSFL